MKKLLTLMFMAALILTGCSKDDDNWDIDYDIDWPAEQVFEQGKSLEFNVSRRGTFDISVIEAPQGWTVNTTNANKIIITPPAQNSPSSQNSGKIIVRAANEENSVPREISVSVQYILTFEAVPLQYLAGHTSYGDNLYSSYGANQYKGYTDTETALKMQINEAQDFFTGDMTREFWNGGVAISQWNDITTAGFANQCSAFYKNATTGFGGNAGSKTFGVVMSASYAGVGSLEFTSSMERTFTSLYVTNGTYVALSMKNGDYAAKKFEDGDWFKVIITGIKADGSESGKVEHYLADFRTPVSGGIVKEWEKVDLTSLEAVNKLEFTFDSSDTGEWGMNTPTYVCIDDVAFN